MNVSIATAMKPIENYPLFLPTVPGRPLPGVNPTPAVGAAGAHAAVVVINYRFLNAYK